MEAIERDRADREAMAIGIYAERRDSWKKYPTIGRVWERPPLRVQLLS